MQIESLNPVLYSKVWIIVIRLEGSSAVNQTMVSNQKPALLDNAITKLRPDIFSHPVWVRFGSKNEAIPSGTIDNLFVEVENLKQNNPSAAFQVLLICAVSQHYSGQSSQALGTIQKAQELAERGRLDQEILWALWGACAICVQQKQFQEASAHLATLKRMLSDQNDWILAGFVDVIKQALPLPTTITTEKLIEPYDNPLLTLTFQWLNTWGFSAQTLNQGEDANESKNPIPTQTKSWLTLQGWQGRWRSLRLMFKGELKVNWLDISSRSGKKRSSFWGFILSLLHIEVTSQENETDALDAEVETPENAHPLVLDYPPAIVIPEVENKTVASEAHVNDPDPPQELVEAVSISVHLLGSFNLTIQDTTLRLRSSRSLSLLKYLILNHKQIMPRDVLMELFWADTTPEKARNNLNVAMNGIRHALRAVTNAPVILYRDHAYGISLENQVWVDVEEFERLVEAGRELEAHNKLHAAISRYEAAISLYQGDFLEENPYENWTVLPRERLRLTYLDTLDRLNQINFNQENYAMCITLSQLILTRDRCREDAHCMLMRCYSRQGQDHLALRQYQACVEALRLELDVTPAPETTKLYELIHQHKHV